MEKLVELSVLNKNQLCTWNSAWVMDSGLGEIRVCSSRAELIDRSQISINSTDLSDNKLQTSIVSRRLSALWYRWLNRGLQFILLNTYRYGLSDLDTRKCLVIMTNHSVAS